MYAGTAARIGAHGSSWTQTLFRVGDINISAPDGSGTPLALPGVLEWDSVDVNTGIVRHRGEHARHGGEPHAPPAIKHVVPAGRAVGRALRPSRREARVPPPPAIARLNLFGNASVLLSGPLRDRLGARVRRHLHTRRPVRARQPSGTATDLSASAFAHLVYTVSPRDEVRTVLWVQRSTTPVERSLIFAATGAPESTTSVSLQTTWERRGTAEAPSWRGYAAVSSRGRSQEPSRSASCRSSACPTRHRGRQIYRAPGTERVWQIGATMKPQPFEGVQSPARCQRGHRRVGWVGDSGFLVQRADRRARERHARASLGLHEPRLESRWHQTTFSVYAADRVVLRPTAHRDGGAAVRARRRVRPTARRTACRGRTCCPVSGCAGISPRMDG